jgi:hypothetical protein
MTWATAPTGERYVMCDERNCPATITLPDYMRSDWTGYYVSGVPMHRCTDHATIHVMETWPTSVP